MQVVIKYPILKKKKKKRSSIIKMNL
jgi:hypothetical protein